MKVTALTIPTTKLAERTGKVEDGKGTAVASQLARV